MARRRRDPLLLAALAVLFLGAGTAATLLVREEASRDRTSGPTTAGDRPTAGAPPGSAPPPIPGREEAEEHPPPARDATLRVVVLSAVDRTPLRGARVRVVHGGGVAEALAGTDGAAEFEGLPRGWGGVHAEAAGWGGPGLPVHLDAGRTTSLEILLRRTVPVAGRVLDEGTEAPVAGARVTLRRTLDVPYGTATGAIPETGGDPEVVSAADGSFLFAEGCDPESGGRVVAVAPGRRAAEAAFGPWERLQSPHRILLRLEPGATCRGIVRFADGSPAPGASVLVFPGWVLRNAGLSWRTRLEPAGSSLLRGRSGPGGSYAVEGLARDGDYLVGAFLPGRPEISPLDSLHVPPGVAEVQADITLESPGGLELRWRSSSGVPEARVAVRRRPDPGGPFEVSRWVKAGAGRAAFEDLSPGLYEVDLETEGRWDAAEARVEPGASVEVVLDLDAPPSGPGQGAGGVVLDEEGRPQRFVTVSLRTDSAHAASTTTGEAGTFRFRLPGVRGRYWLTAVRGEILGRAGPFEGPAADLRIVLAATGSVEGEVAALPAGPEYGEAEFLVRSDLLLLEGAGPWRGPLTRKVPLRGGRFLLQGLPRGPCVLEGRVGPLHLEPRRVEVLPGRTADLGQVAGAPERKVTGRVVDAAGAPLPEAQVRFDRDGLLRKPFSGATCDAGGRFLVEGVPPGEATLMLSSSGRGTRFVTVPAGGDADLGDLALTRKAHVSGCVRGEDGALHQEGVIEAIPAGGGEAKGTTVPVSGQGSYDLFLEAGEWEIRLLLPGAAAPAVSVRVGLAEGEERREDLRGGRRP
ncbi:MAG: carboxypeptidase-like regulatory domain-containing protein [Planctomycetes bacterium]|nr:carboxypeptidase-like regulatory domain-containing protein [Planctomycetota bacterium]